MTRPSVLQIMARQGDACSDCRGPLANPASVIPVPDGESIRLVCGAHCSGKKNS